MNNDISVIKGLTYIKNFITEQEEKDITEFINKQKWNTSLSRRTQHYGYEYPYSTKNKLIETTKIPDIFNPLLEKINKYFNKKFDQLIINEYMPGQGISPHIDHIRLFDDTVISVSMGSDCIMEFKYYDKKIEVLLEKCSLVGLQNDARYKWSHSIPARTNDNGKTRNKRISLTFRIAKKIN